MVYMKENVDKLTQLFEYGKNASELLHRFITKITPAMMKN